MERKSQIDVEPRKFNRLTDLIPITYGDIFVCNYTILYGTSI